MAQIHPSLLIEQADRDRGPSYGTVHAVTAQGPMLKLLSIPPLLPSDLKGTSQSRVVAPRDLSNPKLLLLNYTGMHDLDFVRLQAQHSNFVEPTWREGLFSIDTPSEPRLRVVQLDPSIHKTIICDKCIILRKDRIEITSDQTLSSLSQHFCSD